MEKAGYNKAVDGVHLTKKMKKTPKQPKSLKNQNILCHELSECIDFMPEKNNINKLSYQRQNKKSLKYESKMVSQKIKKYSK